MKNMAMVILVGLLTLVFSFPAVAAMSHQPHSVKTFMGKKRPQSTVVSQADKAQTGASTAKTHIKSFYKTHHRISGRK